MEKEEGVEVVDVVGKEKEKKGDCECIHVVGRDGLDCHDRGDVVYTLQCSLVDKSA